MLDRLLSILVALCLAFLVWLYARSRDQEILDNVPLPVSVRLATSQTDEYSLEVAEPAVIPVSFTGPPSRIRELRGMLQRGELRVEMTHSVPPDRQQASRYLDTVRVEASDVPAPHGVIPVITEGRNRVPVTLHRLVERRLPVRLEQTPHDRIGQVTVEPATVLVRGPEEVLERLRAVPCPWDHESIAAWERRRIEAGLSSTRSHTLTHQVALPHELENRPVHITPSVVTVQVTLLPRKKIYDLDLAVNFLTPAGFPLRPSFNGDGRDSKVFLSVEGPATDEPPQVHAFIDLTRRKFEPGLHLEPLRLQLPKDFQVIGTPPRLLPFRLDSPDAMPSPGGPGLSEP